MKKTISVIFFFAAILAAGAQQRSEQETPEDLQLIETEYDFAKIPQGKPVFHFFTIKNAGSQTIKIDNVQASCGCTTPEWDKAPILPNSSAKIKVGYNAAAEGYFEKSITISYNTTQRKQIKIKGTVWKTPSDTAPANESIQFLKQ